jgi:endonuclease/exonuclease/phosphatase family metal-dependent hydrolase
MALLGDSTAFCGVFGHFFTNKNTPHMSRTIIANDNLSTALTGIIPPEFKGRDEFLDIISWNIRWFNDSDPVRVQRVTEILSVLNADIFVFQEIRNNSLNVVAERLSAAGAGDYKVAYGTTGGDQRVAILYDYEWVKAKDDIAELFGKKTVLTDDGKDAFPRLPFWGYFSARSVAPDRRGFDFQLAGVHLKSQMGADGGYPQRLAAAQKLAAWLKDEASVLDSDVIVIGDWNASPERAEWTPIRQMEGEGLVKFESVNDASDFSHLYYKNRHDFGSRLDVVVVSSAAAAQMQGQAGVVRWVSLDDLLRRSPSAAQIRAYIKEIKQNLSDHMPLFTRYYAEEGGGN